MREHPLLRIVLYLHHRLERAQHRERTAMTLNQYRLLYLIQQGPARSVELAMASGLTKPSIGAMIGQLEERGWVARRAVRDDRRASSIRITADGRRAVAGFEATLQEALEQFLGRDAVARADVELDWLFDALQDSRSQAHEVWASRKTREDKEA